MNTLDALLATTVFLASLLLGYASDTPSIDNPLDTVSLQVSPSKNKIQLNNTNRSSPGRSQPDIFIGFEGETPLSGLWMRDVCCNDSITIVDKPVHSGKQAAKFMLRPTHNFSNVGNTYYKTRNEVIPNQNLTRIMASENISEKGKESWYGFSIRPAEDLYISSTFEVVFQLHHINDPCDTQGGNPPIAIYVEGNEYVVQNVGDKDQCQNVWKEVNSNARRWSFPLNRGEWTDWVIHTNWKHTEDGVFEVWRNGKKVIEVHGPVTYNDEKVHYFQFGPYKSPWLDFPRRSNRTYYYDNFRASGPDGSYAEVAPR